MQIVSMGSLSRNSVIKFCKQMTFTSCTRLKTVSVKLEVVTSGVISSVGLTSLDAKLAKRLSE